MNKQPKWNPKLYLVTHKDLPPGVRACQVIHAFREFIKDHPEMEKEWYENSNYIAFLEAENQNHLIELISAARNMDIKHSTFFEPDLKNQLTAAVFEPTIKSRELLKALGKALADEADRPAGRF